MEKLRAVEREGLKTDIPAFAPGDTVRVMVRVREGEKERLQAFEGICIARRGGGINETFTVRKISAGVGVERIFPLHAPLIAEIGLLRKGRVRRAKLYFHLISTICLLVLQQQIESSRMRLSSFLIL